jgi:PKD repeat protein
VAATPDLLLRDGRTTSTVTVTANDAASRPVPNLPLHLDLEVDGVTGGLGTLSQRDVVTGSDGRATAIYTSPLRAPDGQVDEATVRIVATPVGSNSANMTGSVATIQLKSGDQAGGPTASFVYSPANPRPNDKILFDARGSAPSTGSIIVGWLWDFGDGNDFPVVPYLAATGPTFSQDYLKSGQYHVVLTVIDSAGRRSQAAKTVFIG